VVAEEERPLRRLGDLGRLLEDVDDRIAVLHVERGEEARHQGRVGHHVAGLAGAEVGGGLLRPEVGLGEEHPAREGRVHVPPQHTQEVDGLGQVLAGGALALEEERDGVEPQPVHSLPEPEVDDLLHLPAHRRALEVEVGLVGVEAVPVVGAGHRVPGPVGRLEVLEEDGGLRVALGVVAPHVELPCRAPLRSAARPGEPGVLVGGVVEDDLGDHSQAAPVGLVQEVPEVGQAPVGGVDGGEVGDVVAVVLPGRGVERLEPESTHPEVLEVVEPRDEAAEVAHPVPVAVEEGADGELVDDGVLVPEGLRPEGDGPAPRRSRRRPPHKK
jgi:hypothetical protein